MERGPAVEAPPKSLPCHYTHTPGRANQSHWSEHKHGCLVLKNQRFVFVVFMNFPTLLETMPVKVERKVRRITFY
jgi:hypothetical protein